MSKDRIYFNHSPKPTIGVEVELYTVSKQDYNLCQGAPAIHLDKNIRSTSHSQASASIEELQ